MAKLSDDTSVVVQSQTASPGNQPPAGAGTLFVPRTTPFGLAIDQVNASEPTEVLYTWLVPTVPDRSHGLGHRFGRAARFGALLGAGVTLVMAVHTGDSPSALGAVAVIAAVR